MTEEFDDLGRSLKTGKFVKGQAKAGPGRPKGSRNKMTNKFLTLATEREEAGLGIGDFLYDLLQDPSMPPELRFKSAAKLADLIYPKASSVEVTVDDKDSMTPEQMDARLKQLLAVQE